MRVGGNGPASLKIRGTERARNRPSGPAARSPDFRNLIPSGNRMGSLSTYLSSPEGIAILVGILFLILMANACHEGAHALTAWWHGDRRESIRRRCTLNPLAHFSWFLTLILPLLALWLSNGMAIFGGAKPVMVDRQAVGRWGMARVALAGPIANFLFAGFLLVLLAGAIDQELFGLSRFDWVRSWVWRLLVFPLWFAYVLGLINLIPFPGLDGGHVLASFLPARVREIWYRLSILGPILLLILLLWLGGFLYHFLGVGDPPPSPSPFELLRGRIEVYVTEMVRFFGDS